MGINVFGDVLYYGIIKVFQNRRDLPKTQIAADFNLTLPIKKGIDRQTEYEI